MESHPVQPLSSTDVSHSSSVSDGLPLSSRSYLQSRPYPDPDFIYSSAADRVSKLPTEVLYSTEVETTLIRRDFENGVSLQDYGLPRPVLKTTPFGEPLPTAYEFQRAPEPPTWGEANQLKPDSPGEVDLNCPERDEEEVRELIWTESQRKTAHRIWLDTVQWEKHPQLHSILEHLDEQSNNLPVFHLKTYSTCERPRRVCLRRRFPVSDCWMFFSDVAHAVWIDCNGFPDLTKRSDELVKEETTRNFIPSHELQNCTVEQLKEQQDLIAELKRYLERAPDVEFVRVETDSSSSSEDDEGDESIEENEAAEEMAVLEGRSESMDCAAGSDDEYVEEEAEALSDDDEDYAADESTESDDLF